jgi:hypothetical protein
MKILSEGKPNLNEVKFTCLCGTAFVCDENDIPNFDTHFCNWYVFCPTCGAKNIVPLSESLPEQCFNPKFL